MELNERDIDLQKEAPTLAAIGNGIPFTLPIGYFDELSEDLRVRVLIETIHVESRDGFNVPKHYFEDLTDRIESRVSVENIRSIAPSEGFVLPEDYFTGLSTRINSRIQESTKIEKPVRNLFTSWIAYAAAACITVMIGTGIYFNSNSESFDQRLSEIPDQEILNYLQAHSTAGDTPFIVETLNSEEMDGSIPDISAEELELYINNTTL